MDLQYDALHWKLDGTDLSPLATPKAILYPEEADVRLDTVYGYDGQYVGTMTYGIQPDSPTLSATDLGSGSVRITVSGSSDGSETDLYVRGATETDWPTTPSATVTGDGSVDLALGAGPYLLRARSRIGEASAAAENEPLLFHLQDASAGYTRSAFGQEFLSDALPELLSAFAEPITYRRGAQAVELVAMQGSIVTTQDTQTGIDVPVGDASWEISADDLDFGSGPIVPKAQDQILSATGEVYVVVAAGTLDAEQLLWTIPVKRSEYRELP